MAELPHPWSAYQRLQSQLDEHNHIDDRNWGLEAALNSILNTSQASPPSEVEIVRSIASEARRERHRAHLRRKHLTQSEPVFDPRKMLEARSSLRAIRSFVAPDDWKLLVALSEGHEYQELGAPGRLRVRVLRLRHDVREHHSLAA
jgi:hypothetical protein